jgi:hypothetical protein
MEAYTCIWYAQQWSQSWHPLDIFTSELIFCILQFAMVSMHRLPITTVALRPWNVGQRIDVRQVEALFTRLPHRCKKANKKKGEKGEEKKEEEFKI